MTQPEPARSAIVLGVFAGGQSTRMGRDKASLRAPDSDEELLPRLLRLGRSLGCECVVVGGPPRGAARLVPDQPAGVGPLGGLGGLLAYAAARPALALACDLPHVTIELIERLMQASSIGIAPAPIVAPRDPHSGKWQALFARYDAPRVLPLLQRALGQGVRSFQTFFAQQDVAELELSAAEHALLRDWDAPSDLLG